MTILSPYDVELGGAFDLALQALKEDIAASGAVDDVGTALARGMQIALAAPEAAQAMLLQIGIPPETLRAATVDVRHWLAEHPIVLATTVPEAEA